MNKILITGGLGFIGSNLALRLASSGVKVTIVDSLVPKYGGNLFNIAPVQDAVCINISDVRDPYSMEHLVKGQDVLFNLAGQTSHMDSMQDPLEDLEINARSQLSILESCRKFNPDIVVVFASTRQLYGRPRFLPVNETHPTHPVDVNGINKLAGEQYHILYDEVYGIKTVCLRLTNTYGPRMRIKDARQTFVGIWVRNVLQNIPFEVWGGEQLRDFNYVEDVVDALLLAATTEKCHGQVYNLGSDEVVSLRTLASDLVSLRARAGFDVKAFPEERKKIDIGDYYSDFSKFREVTGWTPKVPLKQGLQQTLDYFDASLENYL